MGIIMLEFSVVFLIPKAVSTKLFALLGKPFYWLQIQDWPCSCDFQYVLSLSKLDRSDWRLEFNIWRGIYGTMPTPVLNFLVTYQLNECMLYE